MEHSLDAKVLQSLLMYSVLLTPHSKSIDSIILARAESLSRVTIVIHWQHRCI